MIYYSTGKSRHLPIRGRIVDVNQQTGELLISKGMLVIDKSELYEKTEAVSVQQETKVVHEEVILPKIAPKEKAKKPVRKVVKAKPLKNKK
jgi:hypothetical protein